MNTKAKAIEIIKGKTFPTQDRLYWISDTQPPKNVAKSFYFNIDNVFALTQVGSGIRAILPGFRAPEPGQDLEVRDVAEQAAEASRIHYQHHLSLYFNGLRQNGQCGLSHGRILDNNPRLFRREGLLALQGPQTRALPRRQLRLVQLQMHRTFFNI